MSFIFLTLGIFGLNATYEAVKLQPRDVFSAAYLLGAALFSGLCFLASGASYAGEAVAKALKDRSTQDGKERETPSGYKGPIA